MRNSSTAAGKAAPVKSGLTSYPRELEEAETLTKELGRLLEQHAHALDEKNVRREVEILERWISAYRRGVVNARRISPTEISLLGDLRDHLKLAIEERQRLADEGGRAPTEEESERLDGLMKTTRRIERMLNLAQALHTAAPQYEEA
jgi:hypothetical protein